MLKHLLYLVALLLLFPVLVHGDQVISVSLASQKMPMPAGRLDFGIVNEGDTKSAVLTVTNLSAKSLVLDVFGFGNNVRAIWQKDPSSRPPSTRIELLSQQQASLEIKVHIPAEWNSDSRFPEEKSYPVVTISNGTAIATIQISYVCIKASSSDRMDVSGSLPSGLGEWWSPMYNLCLGAAAPHNRLKPGSVRMDLSSENPAHERSCGRWAVCNIYKHDDSDVCVQFQVQGHHESDGTQDGHNEVVMFNARLSASYEFIPQPPPVLGEAFK
jgi:hypothetical protein